MAGGAAGGATAGGGRARCDGVAVRCLSNMCFFSLVSCDCAQIRLPGLFAYLAEGDFF